MSDLFWKVLEMSFTGSIVILITILFRFFLRKRSKRFIMILWAVVAVRLIVPVSIESSFSIFNLLPSQALTEDPAAQVSEAMIPDNIAIDYSPAGTDVTYDTVKYEASIDGIDNNTYLLTESKRSEMTADTNVKKLPDIKTVLAVVWLAGTMSIMAYCSFRFVMLKKKLNSASKVCGNVYESGKVKAPFVFGLFVPRIYLPDVLENDEREYILMHERTHIKHGDWLSKIAGMIIVAVHWFNPLVWLGYALFEQDIEMSCDEASVSGMNPEMKKAYTMSIVSYARKSNKRYLVTPLGFSKVSFSNMEVTNRVKNIINYKKGTKITALLISVMLLFVAAACGLNSQKSTDDQKYSVKTAKKDIADHDTEETLILAAEPSPAPAHSEPSPVVSKETIPESNGIIEDEEPEDTTAAGENEATEPSEQDTDSGNTLSEDTPADFASYIRSFTGTAYTFAGDAPSSGFDSSGLVVYCYRSYYDISLPHGCDQMARNSGYEVSIDDISVGDIIFFDKAEHDGTADHCAIYAGNGIYVDALPSAGCVIESDLSSASDVLMVKRILGTAPDNGEPEVTVTPVPEPESSSEIEGGSDFVSYVRSLSGSSYTYGGSSPSEGFDSSGFVTYCYYIYYGIMLPHSSELQAKVGEEIPVDEIKAGDIICFDNDQDGLVDHSAIYAGGNEFIHASLCPTNQGIVESSLTANLDVVATVRRIV